MKRETYLKIIRYFERSRGRALLLKDIAEWLPFFIALVYVCLLAALILLRSPFTLRFILVPLSVLVFVTILRDVIDRPRPYTKMDFEPFLKVKEAGRSFPSRHSASAMVIALAFLYLRPAAGIVMLVLAALVGVSRVVTGMHYISDVLAGILIAALAAVIGFWVI